MIKDKSRLAIKLFIIVWIVLAVYITLKLTFNYWQPYVVSSARLQAISDFIDNHRWLQVTLNGILYVFNGVVVILCATKLWWFKNKKQFLIILLLIIANFIVSVINPKIIIGTLIITFGVPLMIDYKKWLYVILTFVFSNLFLLLSLWLEQFTSVNQMNYFIKVLFQFDYYIMLILNYFAFNLINKENNKNG